MSTIVIALLFPLLVLSLVAVLALLYGAESRPVFNERPEHERFGVLR